MTASLSECMQGKIEVIQEKVVPEVSKANVSVLINKKWGDPIQASLEDSRKRKINLSEKKEVFTQVFVVVTQQNHID